MVGTGFAEWDFRQKPERQARIGQVSTRGSVLKTSCQEQGSGEGPDSSERSGGCKTEGCREKLGRGEDRRGEVGSLQK